MRLQISLFISALNICTAVILPASAGQLACDAPGSARWSIKTTLPAKPKTLTLTLVQALEDSHLPPLTDVKTNDPRFKDTRITGEKVNEDSILTVSGWLYLVAFEPDCDLHIQISPDPLTSQNLPTKDSNSLIVEVPSGQYATTISGKVETVRDWVVANLLHKIDPKIGSIHVMNNPTFVIVTGALFYDDDHEYHADHTTGRGKKGLDSKTLWELHPITSIAFATPPK